MDKVIFGITTQSSSSSSNSSSDDEEEQSAVEELPVNKRNTKNKDKDKDKDKEKEKDIEKTVPIKPDIKVEISNEGLGLKDNENSENSEDSVKKKRGRPSSLEKKSGPPKKVVKKSLVVKKKSSETIVEKRPRGRPRKTVDPVNANSTPIKVFKAKVKSPKESSSISEGIKAIKSTSPLKTKSPVKSPVKENEVDENITSTSEKLKDPDVVEDETVSSSCQDLVRSVKVQTKPINKKPPKSYINKVGFVF